MKGGMFLGGAVVAFDESVIFTGWLNGNEINLVSLAGYAIKFNIVLI
jgi:hypothetical protein